MGMSLGFVSIVGDAGHDHYCRAEVTLDLNLGVGPQFGGRVFTLRVILMQYTSGGFYLQGPRSPPLALVTESQTVALGLLKNPHVGLLVNLGEV